MDIQPFPHNPDNIPSISNCFSLTHQWLNTELTYKRTSLQHDGRKSPARLKTKRQSKNQADVPGHRRFSLLCLESHKVTMSHSEDLDQMPKNAASDLGLHYCINTRISINHGSNEN